MKNCPQCGKELPESALFCPECGASVPEQMVPEVDDSQTPAKDRELDSPAARADKPETVDDKTILIEDVQKALEEERYKRMEEQKTDALKQAVFGTPEPEAEEEPAPAEEPEPEEAPAETPAEEPVAEETPEEEVPADEPAEEPEEEPEQEPIKRRFAFPWRRKAVEEELPDEEPEESSEDLEETADEVPTEEPAPEEKLEPVDEPESEDAPESEPEAELEEAGEEASEEAAAEGPETEVAEGVTPASGDIRFADVKAQKEAEAAAAAEEPSKPEEDSDGTPYGYRNIVKFIVLILITLGIYGLVWIFKTTEQLDELETSEAPRNPWWTLALYMFLPGYRIYWFYKYSRKIDVLCKEVGQQSDQATVTGILAVLAPVLLPMVMMQERLNALVTKDVNAGGKPYDPEAEDEEHPQKADIRSGYRDIVAHALLLFFTFGIYYFYWIHKTTQILNHDESERHMDPANTTLFCIFFGPYNLYWFYKNARKLSHLSAESGQATEKPLFAPVLAGLKLGYVSSILMQERLNRLAALSITGEADAPLHRCNKCHSVYADDQDECPSCEAENRTPFYRKSWFIVLLAILYFAVLYRFVAGTVRIYRQDSNDLAEQTTVEQVDPYSGYDDGYYTKPGNETTTEFGSGSNTYSSTYSTTYGYSYSNSQTTRPTTYHTDGSI